MSEVESERGPQVEGPETLHRVLTTPKWWNEKENRPSSAAFSYKVFSADVASMTTTEASLGRFANPIGIAAFTCGVAREIGFDARHELDPNFPENAAHANTYCDHGSEQRKTRARKLAEVCVPVAMQSENGQR